MLLFLNINQCIVNTHLNVYAHIPIGTTIDAAHQCETLHLYKLWQNMFVLQHTVLPSEMYPLFQSSDIYIFLCNIVTEI